MPKKRAKKTENPYAGYTVRITEITPPNSIYGRIRIYDSSPNKIMRALGIHVPADDDIREYVCAIYGVCEKLPPIYTQNEWANALTTDIPFISLIHEKRIYHADDYDSNVWIRLRVLLHHASSSVNYWLQPTTDNPNQISLWWHYISFGL